MCKPILGAWLFVALGLLGVSACSPDPVKEAERTTLLVGATPGKPGRLGLALTLHGEPGPEAARRYWFDQVAVLAASVDLQCDHSGLKLSAGPKAQVLPGPPRQTWVGGQMQCQGAAR